MSEVMEVAVQSISRLSSLVEVEEQFLLKLSSLVVVVRVRWQSCGSLPCSLLCWKQSMSCDRRFRGWSCYDMSTSRASKISGTNVRCRVPSWMPAILQAISSNSSAEQDEQSEE